MGQVRERDLTRACEEQLFAKADAERRALEWETKSNVHAAEITDLRGQLEAVTKAHAAAARAASEAQDELARATEDKARQARQLEVLQVTRRPTHVIRPLSGPYLGPHLAPYLTLP